MADPQATDRERRRPACEFCPSGAGEPCKAIGPCRRPPSITPTDREALRLTDAEYNAHGELAGRIKWDQKVFTEADVERIITARVEQAITDARAEAHAEHIDDHDEGFTLGEKTGYRAGVRQAKAAVEAVLDAEGLPRSRFHTIRALDRMVRAALSDLGGDQ